MRPQAKLGSLPRHRNAPMGKAPPRSPRPEPGTRNRPLTHGCRLDNRDTMKRQGAGTGGGGRGRLRGQFCPQAHCKPTEETPAQPMGAQPPAPLIGCRRVHPMCAPPQASLPYKPRLCRSPCPLQAYRHGSGWQHPRPQGQPTHFTKGSQHSGIQQAFRHSSSQQAAQPPKQAFPHTKGGGQAGRQQPRSARPALFRLTYM